MSTFNVSDHFFFFDSDSLSCVQDNLYGFALSKKGILEGSGIPTDELDLVDGCGTYVLVEHTDSNTITIRQDFCGDFGVFLYEDEEYFAVSNSFFLLLDRVKTNHHISLNRNYINQFLATWIVSLAYSETAINEIRKLPANAVMDIDAAAKKYSLRFIDYSFNTLRLRSREGMDALDSWYWKWIGFFENLAANTGNIRIDLSGGFDSRLVFLFMLNANIDLNRFLVNSLNDGVHTHKEDYEIATTIAEHYGFELNSTGNISNARTNYTQDEIVELAFHTKMMFQKELTFPNARFDERRYVIGGYGGETIRPYWDMPPAAFLDQQTKFAEQYGWKLSQEVRKSTELIIENSLEAIGKKYSIDDERSPYWSFNMFRECYSRNHFGNINKEGYLNNALRLSPLLDPLVQKMQLEDGGCHDRNLLCAVIFTRYCNELLDFKFDGGRKFDSATLTCAREINRAFPMRPKPQNYKVAPEEFAMGCQRHVGSSPEIAQSRPSISRADTEVLFADIFDSAGTKRVFTSFFDSEFYDFAREYSHKAQYFPLRHMYSVIGVTEILRAVAVSEERAEKNHLKRLSRLFDMRLLEPSVIPLNERIVARIDVALIGGSLNSLEILSISDAHANVKSPAWINRDACGFVIESRAGILDIRVRVNEPGMLKIALRSRDEKDASGKRKMNWIAYNGFSIDEKIMFDEEKLICHDKPFIVEVTKTGVIRMNAEWDTDLAPHVI